MINFSWDRRTLYRNTTLVLALICFALLVHEIFGQHGYLALRRQQKEVQALVEQIRQLQQENEQLSRQIKALQSDPKAIERLAREQMRLARPGEFIYVLPDKDPKNSNRANAKDQPK